MRILGIDPGSRYLGFGLIEARPTGPVHVASGVVRAGTSVPLPERLHHLFEQLQAVMRELEPQAVAVEGVFTHKNARSALILGHARGVVLLLAAQRGLAVHEYAPARVKRSLGAGGNDGKQAVARMVTLQLKLAQPLERADAYDALAVALCHANQHRARLWAPANPTGGRAGRANAASSFADRLAASYVAPRT